MNFARLLRVTYRAITGHLRVAAFVLRVKEHVIFKRNLNLMVWMMLLENVSQSANLEGFYSNFFLNLVYLFL